MSDVERRLGDLAPGDRAARDAVDRALERAALDGAADLAYDSMDTTLGPLLMVRGARGLVRVAYAGGEDADRELERLSERLSPRLVRAPAALDDVRRQIDEYLRGRRSTFEVRVDLALVGPFARRVLDATAAVPYGEVTTYGDLAATVGRPRAARAVGNALGSNPVPIVIPCHRILRAGGGLGGYTGGTGIKRALLGVEGLSIAGEAPS
jgi:methylated-DNA-[protein]-cysteine S-methyltransferase